jgi:hypothetical protein
MEKLIAARTLLGKLSFIALVVSFAGVLDGLSASWRTPENRFDMVSGSTTEIIGKFYGNSTNPSDLGYVADSPGVSLAFDGKVFKGFWLGEDMWRGRVSISPELKEGTHSLRITFRDLSNIKPEKLPKLEKLLTYSVRVFENSEIMMKNDMAAAKRYLGISPWILSACGFPVILFTGLAVFVLSMKIDRAMAENGKAEIFRVSKKEDFLEIHFGLGKNNGLSEGERLMLFNKAGLLISEIFVHSLDSDNAMAIAESSLDVTPGFLVSRI